MRKLVAGNWKMHGTGESLAVIEAIANGFAPHAAAVDAMICPPATLLNRAAAACQPHGISIGAQDCHTGVIGAHTGDLSAEMLADTGARAVILGHSERRGDHGETDRIVLAKVAAAHRAGLVPIVCVGETEGQRRAGLTLDVVERQLRGSIPANVVAEITVAYEPVWAIGTGLTPTSDDVVRVHSAMRKILGDHIGAAAAETRLLYGGSVKPGNAAELLALANVDGALVGGASLKADDFLQIIAAAAERRG